jgi:hypothetical protein
MLRECFENLHFNWLENQEKISKFQNFMLPTKIEPSWYKPPKHIYNKQWHWSSNEVSHNKEIKGTLVGKEKVKLSPLADDIEL